VRGEARKVLLTCQGGEITILQTMTRCSLLNMKGRLGKTRRLCLQGRGTNRGRER